MKSKQIIIFGLLLSFGLFINQAFAANPKALIETSMGNIELELFADKAPVSVENFISYAEEGFYKGTIFHRVIKRFMIQGGGFSADMKKKATKAPIINEADNKIANVKGTIAMARTPDPHSASSQFFINTKDNDFLNFTRKSSNGWGYAVFGKVIKGMDVVMKIESVATGFKNGMRDVPKDTVEIKNVSIIK